MKSSVITKCKKDLRDEFDDTYFYIDGSDKEPILEELNWYNINESTLFPELEHQLNYIKQNNRTFTRPVADFDSYLYAEGENQQRIIIAVSAKKEEEFNESIRQFLVNKLGDELGKKVLDTLLANMVVDWYKRDSVKSKMKMAITSLIGKSSNNPKRLAADIVNYVVEEYIKICADY